MKSQIIAVMKETFFFKVEMYQGQSFDLGVLLRNMVFLYQEEELERPCEVT